MEQSKKKFFGFEKVRKYFPFILLVFLTISLMFFFKHNKKGIGKIIEDGKNNLLSFYAENLKPLLYQTEISDEDVFNLALYNTLPLDKGRNKILEISGNQSGTNTFVIKTTSYNPNTKNYNTFIKYMQMTEAEKGKVDSILNAYKKEIYSSIFVNEKNTYALNPNLGEIQQAVLADIVTFAQKVNKSKSRELFAEHFDYNDKNDLANIILSAKKISQNEYILITPDTVARSYFQWDQEKFNKHLNDIERKEIEIDPSVLNLNIQFQGTNVKQIGKKMPLPNDITFNTDSNSFKIVIPVESMYLPKSIQEKVRIKLNEAADKMRNIHIKFREGRNSGKKSTMAFNSESQEMIINPYEIVNQTMEMLSKSGLRDLEKIGLQMDSLSRKFNPNLNDSSKKKIENEMLKAAKDFKKKRNRIKVDSVKIE